MKRSGAASAAASSDVARRSLAGRGGESVPRGAACGGRKSISDLDRAASTGGAPSIGFRCGATGATGTDSIDSAVRFGDSSSSRFFESRPAAWLGRAAWNGVRIWGDDMIMLCDGG